MSNVSFEDLKEQVIKLSQVAETYTQIYCAVKALTNNDGNLFNYLMKIAREKFLAGK